ncbi:hypothetical protein GTY20_07970 [Streptomyces sp. SID4946]|uniref:hypothetical protein n=1 Tax=Streptomyces sp. LamerLS-31b TaxID=1839765 RepID=UPI00114C9C95|nr:MULTISPECIES: hypothetical protein [unclassified Streptomyces]MYQ91269.1 hypothetical protein [Streptomyces sp. SID4946]
MHDLFSKPVLPDWGFLALIVLILAQDIAGLEAEPEVARFHMLWDEAVIGEQEDVSSDSAECAGAADAADATPVDRDDDVTRAFADHEDAVKQAASAHATQPINSSRRPWGPPHADSLGARRNLGRCLYFLYVDAGTPTFAEAIVAMGLKPNTRETLRKNFMQPEKFSLGMLHKFVRALSEMAPYQDPEHMVPVVTSLWNSAQWERSNGME